MPTEEARRQRSIAALWISVMALGLALVANAIGFFANSDAISSNHRAIKQATRALCTERQQYLDAAASTKQFLIDHPRGIPGVPNRLLINGEKNDLARAKALSDVRCPKH